MPEEKEDKGFKVIDRRGREEDPPSPPPPGNPASAATEGKGPENTGEAPPKPPQEGLRGTEAKVGVPRFLDLVQSLQMGAMVGLGLLQGPDGKRPPVDLPGAKDAIDLLGILQEKTKGNLTK